MSDFARLEALLAELAARERTPGEGRRLKGPLLAALVREIDETILPRRLSLETPAGPLHLAVANRRLQALLTPVPDIEGAEALGGTPLPDAEDPHVPALKTLLERAFGDAEALALSARRLDQTFGSDIGVPAMQLGRAWGVSETGPKAALPPEEMMDAFLAALEGGPVAWLRIKGEAVTGQSGPEARTAALGEQAAVFLDGYFAKFETLFDIGAKACGTLIAGAGEAMVFVEIGEESAFLAGPEAEMLQVAARWQGVVAE